MMVEWCGLVAAGVGIFLGTGAVIGVAANWIREGEVILAAQGSPGGIVGLVRALYWGAARAVGERLANRGLLWGTVSFRRMIADLERIIEKLGRQHERASDYLGRALVNGALGGAASVVLEMGLVGRLGLVFPVIGLVVGYVFTMATWKQAAVQRIVRISRRLPFALDAMVLMIDAGATFTEALATLVEREPEEPLHEELARVLCDVKLGKSLREALSTMAERLEIADLITVVSAIRLGSELGTPLVETLRTQAREIRQKRTARAEKLAREASGKMALPSTLMLLANMLIILGPLLVKLALGELL